MVPEGPLRPPSPTLGLIRECQAPLPQPRLQLGDRLIPEIGRLLKVAPRECRYPAGELGVSFRWIGLRLNDDERQCILRAHRQRRAVRLFGLHPRSALGSRNDAAHPILAGLSALLGHRFTVGWT